MLEAELLLLIITIMTFIIFSISSGVFSLLGTLFLNPQHFDKLSFSNGRGQDM